MTVFDLLYLGWNNGHMHFENHLADHMQNHLLCGL